MSEVKAPFACFLAAENKALAVAEFLALRFEPWEEEHDIWFEPTSDTVFLKVDPETKRGFNVHYIGLLDEMHHFRLPFLNGTIVVSRDGSTATVHAVLMPTRRFRAMSLDELSTAILAAFAVQGHKIKFKRIVKAE